MTDEPIIDKLERDPSDAPVHYGAEEASAWANGYNAALPALLSQLREQREALERAERDARLWRDAFDAAPKDGRNAHIKVVYCYAKPAALAPDTEGEGT